MNEISVWKMNNGSWPSNEAAQVQINYLTIDRLVVPASHPRKHTPRQIKQISRSISTFGFLIPIIVDEADVVLVGVGRLLAARELGYRTVPTIQVSHLSPAQKTAFVIADNRLTEIAKWDDPVLAQQLKELSVAKIDFDIEVTGFEPAEIDLRIESINLDAEEVDAADDLEAGAKRPSVANAGDLWIVGRHRLLCGSALASASFTKLMSDERADMVFTDPPYNVRIDGHATGLGAHRHREFAMASGEMDTTMCTDS